MESSMEKLLDSLLASNDSVAFREPVDWVGLNLTDYTTIIKRPMDLGTVKRQWQQGLYSTPEECAVDVRLIWDNCRTYNAGGVPRRLHKAAKVLSKRFETRFAKLNAPPKPPGSTAGVKRAREGGSTRANGGKRPKATDIPPADDDRRRLAQQLGCARMEDLTAAVHEIDSQCPNALVRNGDAIDVDIDALDTWTFSAVERIVSPLAHLRRISRGKDRRARKKTRLAGGASGGKGGVGGGRSGAGGGAAEGGSTSTGRGGRPYKKTRAETSPS